MDWSTFEQIVCNTASYRWNCAAAPEEVNGVKCDCVLKPAIDSWILIEITQEESLAKLRTDLAKFAVVRPYLLEQAIHCSCFFVCEQEPPPSLIETGKGCRVTVLSLNAFRNAFFNATAYFHTRSEKPFGSAVDPFSGASDKRHYIPVTYFAGTKATAYTIDKIVELLRNRRRVILLGSYGAGKSRCVKEVYCRLQPQLAAGGPLPLAINLRENWGVQRAQELIRRHFDDLGLSESGDAIVRMIGSEGLCLLLDGFDEIGSQSWSDNPARLRELRAKSLAGVKDVVANSKGGVLVTGREHYFNSDEEMFSCLGCNAQNTLILRCPEEFSSDQMGVYFSTAGIRSEVPAWLPKRPLICQILSSLDTASIRTILDEDSGELSFWDTFLGAICQREAKINPTLEPSTIRQVLLRVARMTRSKKGNVGPISIHELNRAFEDMVGVPPTDEAAIMLQRLPTLGRMGPESTDRQFVDEYMLDGLRAEDTTNLVNAFDVVASSQPWINPLRDFGLRLLERDLDLDSDSYHRAMVEAAAKGNHVLASDILSALCSTEGTCVNGANITIQGSHFSRLSLKNICLQNAVIEMCVIDELDITNAQAEDVAIRDCEIGKVIGVTTEDGLPNWCKGNKIWSFQSLATVTRIKNAPLSAHQRVFVTIIKKTFFQPGSGRMEAALLRGLGAAADRRAAHTIINRLMDAGILTRNKGREGWVYHPAREHTKRMAEIMRQLTLSKDPLWITVSKAGARSGEQVGA